MESKNTAKILNKLSDCTTLLNDGCLGVVPTDTLYGIVCRAADEVAAKKLYQLKNRESKPGTIIAASSSQLEELGFKHRYLKAVEHLWPNPLSVVLPCGDNLAYLHHGLQTVAVRIVADKKVKDLLEQTGPLLTSSANHPGQPPANTILEAQEYFGDNVDFYVDGGDLIGRLPSTVVRIIDDAIEVLRQGAVDIDESGRISK